MKPYVFRQVYKAIVLVLSFFFAFQFNHLSAQNNGLDFDGIDDQVNINDDPSLNFSITDKYTIESWVKTTANGYRIIVSKRIDISPFTGFEFILTNGLIDFSICGTTTSSGVKVMSTTAFNDGNWHHVAAVYNGIPNGNNIDLYADGILQAKTIPWSTLTGVVTSTDLVTIGSRQNVTAYNFMGSIDEVRIWKRALCAQEIYARKDCQLLGNELDLVAYYKFNQGVAAGNNSGVTSLPDISGYNNTGTLVGFALSGPSSNWVNGAPVSGTCGPFGPLAISGNTLVCSGSTSPNVLTASGATTYTWSTGANGSSIVISPVTNSTFAVVATGSNACTMKQTFTVQVSPSPTLNALSSNSIICSGQPATLTASGATTYTWNNTIVASSLVVNPTSTSTYTVFGTNSGSCTGSFLITQSVSPSPTINVQTNRPSLCVGQSATLSASGASSYSYNGSGGSNSLVVSPTVSSTYTIIGINSEACAASTLFTQTVSPNPTVTAQSNRNTMCKGQSATLTASGAISYTWNGSSISPSLVVSPAANTNYTINGSNSAGCFGTTLITQSVIACSGLDQFSNKASTIRIYPNPCSGKLIVNDLGSNTLKIYDLTGKLIMFGSSESSDHVFELDLLAQPDGIYFVRVSDAAGNTIQTSKVILLR